MRAQALSESLDAGIRGWQRRVLAWVLIVLCLLLWLRAAPHVHAGGTGAIISWDSSMLFPSQNNGNPWGPVGELARVQGQHFAANTAYDLTLVPGDTTSDPAVCQSSGLSVVDSVTSDATGAFAASFLWPSAAGTVGQTYSICGRVLADSSLYSLLDGNGPFTVLANQPASLRLPGHAVAAGESLNVSGENWVPPQPVQIVLSTCASCPALVSTMVRSSGLHSGTFTASLPLPADLPAGTYVINATAQALDASKNAAPPSLVVNPPAVSSPLLTTTPPPTPTTVPSPAAPALVTSPATPQQSSPAPDNSRRLLLALVLGAIALVTLAIIGLLFFLLGQHQSQAPQEWTQAPSTSTREAPTRPVSADPPPPAPRNPPAEAGTCVRCTTRLEKDALFCGICGAVTARPSDSDQLTPHI